MRRWLNHVTPWQIEHPEFFITLCCRPRGCNQLCREDRADCVLETVKKFHQQHRWFCSIVLLMPDHLHAIVQILGRKKFSVVISQFKQQIAISDEINWQKGCFEHRIRHAGSYAEKFAYIENNPVAAGLVAESENWPWKWQP